MIINPFFPGEVWRGGAPPVCGTSAPAAKPASTYRLHPTGSLEFRYPREAAYKVEDVEKPTYTSRIEAHNWCSNNTKIET